MKVWKAPNRKKSEITQTYNTGVAIICRVEDESASGYAPRKRYVAKIAIPYEEKRVGMTRYFAFFQNQISVDKLIRVQAGAAITTQDVADIGGYIYRIDQIQTVDGVYPASVDLTLTRIEQKRGGDFCAMV